MAQSGKDNGVSLSVCCRINRMPCVWESVSCSRRTSSCRSMPPPCLIQQPVVRLIANKHVVKESAGGLHLPPIYLVKVQRHRGHQRKAVVVHRQHKGARSQPARPMCHNHRQPLVSQPPGKGVDEIQHASSVCVHSISSSSSTGMND